MSYLWIGTDFLPAAAVVQLLQCPEKDKGAGHFTNTDRVADVASSTVKSRPAFAFRNQLGGIHAMVPVA